MRHLVGRVDRFQRDHRAAGIPLAVAYKYADDEGHFLAAALTYYAFVAIFPLLLLLSSILGWLLAGNEELQMRLLLSTLGQFPIVGRQLGTPEELQGSPLAIAVGLLVALYGVSGLGQAAQNVLNTAWAVPRNSRLNPVMSRLRTLGLMVVGGVVVVALAVMTSLLSNLDAFGVGVDGWLQLLSTTLSLAVTAVVLSLMMRYTTARRPSFRTALPGGVTIAVGWHLLQLLGGVYVGRVVTRASEMNGVFALVLGLIALLFVASVIAVLGVEVSVVLRRRLYPRALLAPFTDHVTLTEADRRAYDSYAKAQRHKGFQHVDVRYDDVGERAPARDGAAVTGPDPGQEGAPSG